MLMNIDIKKKLHGRVYYGSCIILMMSKRIHLIVIIKKGENVNVCIHDFDDAKDKRFSSLIRVKNSEIQKITPKSHNSSENNSWESHLFKRFLNGHQRSINRWLGKQNVWERYSKRTSLPNTLSKETLGQTLENSLRVSPWTSIVISFSSRDNSSFFLLIQRDWLRGWGSLKL